MLTREYRRVVAQCRPKTPITRVPQVMAKRKLTLLYTTKKRFQRRRNIMDEAAMMITGFWRALIARRKLACPPETMLVVKVGLVLGAGFLNLRARLSVFDVFEHVGFIEGGNIISFVYVSS